MTEKIENMIDKYGPWALIVPCVLFNVFFFVMSVLQ